MNDTCADQARNEEALALARAALRLVCLDLPHLAGMAHMVKLEADRRVGTAGVFASGRLLVNPDFLLALDLADAAFVMAHELLHLALQTHRRADGTDPQLFNIAHDSIINDMLAVSLERPVPAGGLVLPDARLRSAESLVEELRARGAPASSLEETAMAAAMRAVGLAPPAVPPRVDALPDELERRWFPGTRRTAQRRAAARVEGAAARAVSLELLQKRMAALDREAAPGTVDGEEVALLSGALRGFYRPPWELALQQWLEAVAPGPRSYARPSRRGADRQDVVLAGRKREGWALHLVLDTSGSMSDQIPRALGAIAGFCAGANVGQIHVLQCDDAVTRDEWIDPEVLSTYLVEGFGGSDMSPGMDRLAEDPEVEAAVVITDGAIRYPAQPMPYSVLWALTESNAYFDPPYGQVLEIPPGASPAT